MSEQELTQPTPIQPNNSGAFPQDPSPYGQGTGTTPPPPSKSAMRLSRRNLLIGTGAVGVTAAAITTGILYTQKKLPFSPSVAAAAPNKIAHLLRRAGFGARQSEIDTYSMLGVNGAIDQLINYNSVADDTESKVQALNLDVTNVADLQRWWVLHMLYTKRPLQEKMVVFWHGLLTSSYQKVGGKTGYPYLVTQNQLYRNNALAKYDDLLLAVTGDPAMLYWLDLRLSTKTTPNENYARELMELFTLGVNGGYTQTDVHEVARALTGWRLNRTGTAMYDPNNHDNGQKTFLGQTGNFDYKDVIRIVANHPATGPYLCKRLFSFFAHENPTDDDVKSMVATYYSSGHSIAAVMKTMLSSDAFFSAASYRARIKSPVEYVIGTVRQLNLEVQGQGLSNLMNAMGQNVFAPPNVAGWTGDVGSSDWVNTATWLARVNFINAALGTTTGKQQTAGFDLQKIVTDHNLKTATDFVKYFTRLLIDGQISDSRLKMLVDTVQQPTVSTDSIKLGDGSMVTGDAARNVVYLVLASPEYQLN